MNLKYRKGDPRFRERIVYLLRKCAHEYSPPLSELRVQEKAEDAVQPGGSILALEKQNLVGFISFRPYRPDYFEKRAISNPDRFRGYAYITNLFVSPKCRGNGLAHRIRERGVQLMQELGFKGVVTGCVATNTRMVAINNAMGFELVARVPAKWRGSSQESLIWSKTFT